MQQAALQVGRSYAFREKRLAGAEMLKVKVLEKTGRKGKLKIRFETGPHPGLEEYVASRQMVCAWGERRAVLRDEERAAALDAYASQHADRALATAAGAVLEATGEDAWTEADGTALDEDVVQRILDRASIATAPVDLHRLAYRDRTGRVHLPLDAVITVAQAFAAAEPQAVASYIEDREDEFRTRGNVPGDRWWHDYGREHAPGYALARRWAGLEQEADLLRQEIARLRALVSRAAWDLRDLGKDGKARALLRALDGR